MSLFAVGLWFLLLLVLFSQVLDLIKTIEYVMKTSI